MYAFEIEYIFYILPYLLCVQYPAISIKDNHIERWTGILHIYKNIKRSIVRLD